MVDNNKISSKVLESTTQFHGEISKFCIVGLMLISISFILVFTGEFIIREEPEVVLNWMSVNRGALLLNMLVVAIIVYVLAAITKNLGIVTLIAGGIYQVVCIINYYRYSISGQYLILNDFKLVFEGVKIAQDFTIKFKIHILWSLLLLLWLTAALFIFKWKLNKIRRIIPIIGITIFIIISINNFDKVEVILKKLGIEDNQMFSEINYKTNGFLLTLIRDIPNVMIQKPEDYNRDNIIKIVDKYKASSSILKESIHPNVIMIMDEAMFDITKVQGMKLSKDSLENFHIYQQQYIKGNLIVPVYWGGQLKLNMKF